jgi:O-antigen/teichoic acid export membrane protein
MTVGGRKRFLISYAAISISEMLDLLRPIMLIPIIAGGKGKAAFGAWTQIMATAMLVSPTLTLRLMTALTRFLPGHEKDRNITGYYMFGMVMVAATSAVLFGMTWLLPGPIAQLIFGDSSLTEYVWPAATFFSSSAFFAMLIAYNTAMGKQVLYAVHRSLMNLGSLVVVYLVARRHGVAVCVSAAAAWQTFLTLCLLVEIIARHGWSGIKVCDFPGMYKYAFWMLVTHWVFFLVGYGNRYIIVWLMGLERVAVYNLAMQIATLITLTSAPNDFVLTPMVSAHWNLGQRERARPLIRLAYLVIALLAFPLVGGLQWLGNPLTVVLARKDFLPPAMLLLLLTLGATANGFGLVSATAFRMANRLDQLTLIGVVTAGVSIGLCFLLIPTMGLLGAGLAYCLTTVGSTAVAYVISVRVLGVGLDWIRTVKAAGLGLLVYLALVPLSWLPISDLARVIAGAAVMAVATVVGFFLLRIYRLEEILAIVRNVRRRAPLPPPAPEVAHEGTGSA